MVKRPTTKEIIDTPIIDVTSFDGKVVHIPVMDSKNDRVISITSNKNERITKILYNQAFGGGSSVKYVSALANNC